MPDGMRVDKAGTFKSRAKKESGYGTRMAIILEPSSFPNSQPISRGVTPTTARFT